MTDYVYILKDTTERDVYKIGISNDPNRRVQEINRSVKSQRFSVLHKIKLDNRKLVYEAESFLMSIYRLEKIYPFKIFDGSTEVVRLSPRQLHVIKQLFFNLKKSFKG